MGTDGKRAKRNACGLAPAPRDTVNVKPIVLPRGSSGYRLAVSDGLWPLGGKLAGVGLATEKLLPARSAASHRRP